MRIRVEFLLMHESDVYDVYDVARVPCVGEYVCFLSGEASHEVREVFHVLDADPETQVQAFVRVK